MFVELMYIFVHFVLLKVIIRSTINVYIYIINKIKGCGVKPEKALGNAR